ncbi:trypsin [Nasonia vitripennis]|uniref:Peptidase S1 domain-containing protein n=1 Tax=Nasonia vitripennis TaxID=7425 RepID=A0A7M7IM36_NASVI|nr:trypsin [Nasonia vitripennis]
MFSSLVMINLIVAANTDNLFSHGRIVGGEDATIETYPYQISIQEYGSHICGGSIISTYWVLTAGHCVKSDPFNLNIRAGTSIRDKNGTIHKVDNIIRHQNYFENSYRVPSNDIALLKLKEPFVFDKTHQPIKLFQAAEETAPGVEAIITGFGETNKWGYDGQLQTVSIPIVSKELCNKAYVDIAGGISEGQICASYYEIGRKDSCQGDSGGPLTINGRLAGISSWGYDCAKPKYPGVYTEVAAYRNWIDEYVFEQCLLWDLFSYVMMLYSKLDYVRIVIKFLMKIYILAIRICSGVWM